MATAKKILPAPVFYLDDYGKMINSDEVLKYSLRDAVYLANPKLQECIFIDPANEFYSFSVKETRMGKVILRMMKRVYKMLPKEKPVIVKSVDSVKDVWPRLKEQLKKIDPRHPSIKIQKVLRGRLAMPFQSYVLESLIFAGKFMAQCMKRLGEEDAIFDIVVKELENFYVDENITLWIDYISVATDPFGRPGKYEKSKIENQNMCSLSFEDGK